MDNHLQKIILAKKKIFIIVMFFIFSLNMTTPRYSFSQDTDKTKKIKILATIYPYFILLKDLTADNANVDLLIPSEMSPHLYPLKPSDLKKINDADLIIANGLMLEPNIEKVLRQHKGTVLFISDIIMDEISKNKQHINHDKHVYDDEDKEKNDKLHSHGEINPHIWLNPIFLIKVTSELEKNLSQIDSTNKDKYKDNADKIIDELKKLDIKISEERKNYKEANIITFHPSFDYFLGRYNINLVAVFESSPGKQLSLKELAEMKQIIIKNNVKAIFTEPQLNPKNAQIVSKEFGLQTFTLDPLGASLKPNRLVDLIDKNWQIMKNGFVK